MDNYKKICEDIYVSTFDNTVTKLVVGTSGEKQKKISSAKRDQIEIAAQKEAIKETVIRLIRQFPALEPAIIWRAIYEIHVHRKSGIDNAKTIEKVISADQSWKKSSGHAFEEMVKCLGAEALTNSDIEIVLQRDLNVMIKAGELANEPRDISWLKEQIDANIFDLYAIVHQKQNRFCFGCVQSKTSIRDRVTRDREPSIAAMKSFFWSVIFVLDGDFLKNPKFVSMVNGRTAEHPQNGWHGMYVFSEKYSSERIYPLHIDFETFKLHAVQAAETWLTQRQWFNQDWIAK